MMTDGLSLNNKIRKIILVMLYKHFEKKDYIAFDVDIIKKSGYEIEIWDFCNLQYNYRIELPVNAYEGNEVRYFSSIEQIEKYFQQTKIKNIFFVIYPGEGNDYISNHLRKKIKCNHGKYANYYYPPTIHTSIEKICHKNLFATAKEYLSEWRNNPYKAYKDIQYIKSSSVYPSTYEFLQGQACIERVNNRFIRNSKKCKILHSFDYDAHIREQGVGVEGVHPSRYAVFIDEYNTGHSDFKKMGVHPPINDDKKYFEELNTLFKMIEQKYSLEVVIAMHPKAEYINNPFEGRKMYLYKTHELIRSCSICILHTSTCFPYILYCQKPYLQVLTSELIQNEAYYSEMKQYEKYGYSKIVETRDINIENIENYINYYDEGIHKKYIDYYLNPYNNSDKLNMSIICECIDKIR